MSAYDPNNIFARILRGEIPCHRIYEDETSLAFMDLMPQSKGHCLVLPKAPSRNLLDADPEVLADIITRVQVIAKAAKTALNADGIRVMQFNETVSGQTIFHLHFHVIPVYEGIPVAPHAGAEADHGELAELAERISAAIAQD